MGKWLGLCWGALEDGHEVTLHVPQRYPIRIRLNDCGLLEERVMDCWYPCRKGINTLLSATRWESHVVREGRADLTFKYHENYCRARR